MQGPPPPPGQISSNQGSSKAAMILAALLPLPFHFVGIGLLLFVLGGPQEFARAVEAAGPMGLGAISAGFFAAIANTVLFVFYARGARAPAAIAVVIAATPWLVGLVGVWTGTTAGAEALTLVNPADKATIAAASISEALYSRIIGAWIAGAQLAAAALGLAIAALGRKAPSRSPVGAMFSAFPAATIACAVLAMPLMGRMPGLMFLPSLVVVTAMILGAFAAGDDAHGRSGSLATASAFAGALCIGAVCAVVVGTSLAEMFGAVAMVNPADKGAILITGALEVAEGGAWLRAGAWAAIVGAVCVGIWAMLRGEQARASVPSFLVTAVIAVSILAGDPAVVSASSDQLARASAAGRSAISGDALKLVQIDAATEAGEEPDVALLADGTLHFPDGARLAAGDPQRATRLKSALQKPGVRYAPYGSRDDLDVPDLEAVAVAVAEGVDAAALNGVVREVENAGGDLITFVGSNDRWHGSQEDLDKAAAQFPFVRELVNARGAVQVYVPRAADAVAMGAPQEGWHLIVSPGNATLPVEAATKQAGFSIPMHTGRLHYGWPYEENARQATGRELLHLAAGEGATAEQVLLAASRVDALGYRPVLHTEGFDPKALAALRAGDDEPAERFDGPLPPEVIKRVVQAQVEDVRSCYEEQLVKNPRLQGKVVVSMVIAEDGNVSEAEVQESTLRSKNTEACVVDVVRALKFPRSGELVKAHYPFVFKPAR